MEPGIWRWIFHLFFHINLGRVELLHEQLQGDLSTGRLADGICMVIELLHDLSTGHRAEEHRLDSWNWSQKLVAKEARIGWSVFTMEGG